MEIAAFRRIVRVPVALVLLLALWAILGGCMRSQSTETGAETGAEKTAEASPPDPGARTGGPTPTLDHPPSLFCLLGPPRKATLGGPIEVSFVLRNTGPAPVWVLRWGTPLEDFRGDALRIVDPNGQPLEYQGPMVKRGDPAAQDYVRLEAGASTERVVDVAAAYEFTTPGQYSLSFESGLFDTAMQEGDVPRRRDQLQQQPLSCGPFEFVVDAAK